MASTADPAQSPTSPNTAALDAGGQESTHLLEGPKTSDTHENVYVTTAIDLWLFAKGDARK